MLSIKPVFVVGLHYLLPFPSICTRKPPGFANLPTRYSRFTITAQCTFPAPSASKSASAEMYSLRSQLATSAFAGSIRAQRDEAKRICIGSGAGHSIVSFVQRELGHVKICLPRATSVQLGCRTLSSLILPGWPSGQRQYRQ